MLVSLDEMKCLFDELSPFFIYATHGVIEGDGSISQEAFLNIYAGYLNTWEPLKACVWTLDPEAVERREVSGGRTLIRPKQPVIQVQNHAFHFSEVDQTFHPGIQGKDSIAWGIQCSYPQIFQNPESEAFEKVDQSFPNTALYKKLAKWTRNHTRATPFLYQGKKINVPMRLGKECFSWVNTHPQLATKGLLVYEH